MVGWSRTVAPSGSDDNSALMCFSRVRSSAAFEKRASGALARARETDPDNSRGISGESTGAAVSLMIFEINAVVELASKGRRPASIS